MAVCIDLKISCLWFFCEKILSMIWFRYGGCG